MLPLNAPLWQQSSRITAVRADALSSISLMAAALTAVDRRRSIRVSAAARYSWFRSFSRPWPL